jgi:hypothetical protein
MDLFTPATLQRLEVYGEAWLVYSAFDAYYPHVWRAFNKTRVEFATPDAVLFNC